MLAFLDNWEGGGNPESKPNKWIIFSVRVYWPEAKVTLLQDKENQPMSYEHHSSVYINWKNEC